MRGTMRRMGGRGRGLHSTVAAAVLAVLAAAGPAPARAAAPELKWKFAPGQALEYQMDQKTATELKSNNGQNTKTTFTQTINTTWAVQSVDTSGTADVAQSFDRIRAKVDSPFGAFEYDSKDEKAPEGPIASVVVPMLKPLVGAKFRFKISPRGELSDVQVPEALVKSLREAGPAATGVMMFSEEGLKTMIRESSLILPAEGLDQPWTRTSKIPYPPIGTMEVNKTYKYEGAEGGNEKIGLTVKLELKPEENNKLDVKIGNQEGKGTFVFDNKAGRVVSSNVSQKIETVINVQNVQVNQTSDTSTAMKLVKATEAAGK